MAALHGHLYVVGGDGPSRHAARFDIKRMQWEELPPMPHPRDNPGITVAGDRIVVAGVASLAASGDAMIQFFDPRTCKWSMGPTLPWASAHPAVAAIGSRVYVISGETWFRSGGDLDSRTVTDVASFDLGSSAITKHPPLPRSRAQATAVAVNDSIWIVGGIEHWPHVDGGSAMGEPVFDLQQFTPATATWAEPIQFASHRNPTAVVLGQRIVAFDAGLIEGSQARVYDVKTGQSTEGKRLERFDFVVGGGVIDGKIYLLASKREGADTRTEIRRYEIATDTYEVVWRM